MKKKSYFLSLVLTFLMVFNLLSPQVFAQTNVEEVQTNIEETLNFLPEVTSYVDEDTSTKIPNAIPMTINPRSNGTGVDVTIGNVGVDGLDSVTVTVKASGYSSSKSQTAYVFPIVGKKFSFNFPMIKCNTTYDVTVKITDGGQTKTKTGKGTLNYSESTLQKAKWHRGTYPNRVASLEDHSKRHGYQVNTNNIVAYLNKATSYRSEVISDISKGNTSKYNITVGTGAIPSKKYKHKTDRRYILLSNVGQEIFSFGV